VTDLLKRLIRRAWSALGLPRGEDLGVRLARAWATFTLPATVLFLLIHNPRIHPAYGLTWRLRFKLARRMWRTTRGVTTGTSYKAHLAMAAKLLEIPPDVKGSVVECGCWYGGSTANLSLVCDIVGRELIVYDSFEGLPPPEGNDLYAKDEATGMLKADLELVKDNVRRFGAIDRCRFRKGWFKDTLPDHTEPVVLAFLDVDWQASLDDCVTYLWPHLTEQGYVFIDEFVLTDYCALFWSESWWQERFGTTPPGLIGSGSGVGLGGYYLGPFDEWNWSQDPTSVAYTRKDFSGHWSFRRGAESGAVPVGMVPRHVEAEAGRQAGKLEHGGGREG
jgi:O-methyltransferase